MTRLSPMSNTPWNPVPGWDVPRDYYAPDEPSANEDSFDAMVEERMNMVPANEDEAQRGLNDTFLGDPYPVAGVLQAIRQRSVQALHAGISRHDWHATETAANELRDRLDDLIRRLS
jgi:hypothetical protein